MGNKKCPKCGFNLKLIKEQFSIAWVCQKCGYGEATTISEPIYDDETFYKIALLENDSNDMVVVKTISKFTGLNYLQSKHLIENRKDIYTGKAYEILDKKKILDENNVKYKIIPEFPY